MDNFSYNWYARWLKYTEQNRKSLEECRIKHYYGNQDSKKRILERKIKDLQKDCKSLNRMMRENEKSKNR